MEKNREGKNKMVFGVFNGCLTDLNLIDFSRLNLRFVNGHGSDVKNQFNEKFENIDEILERLTEISIIIGGYAKHMQLLIPIDFSKPTLDNDIKLVEEILKIFFPSDLTLNFIERFTIIENKASFKSATQYEFKQTGHGHENYLKINPNEFKNANRFIDLFFQNYLNIGYFKNVATAYLSSFHQNFKTMEFISLCISLESIIEGKQELNYRIKRNVAILIGQDKQTSKLIFKNIGKIYDLRSSIVHSSKYDESALEQYLPYLRDIVSVLLIEIIFQNISDLATLNNILTENGFGDKQSLSKNYVGFKFYNKSHINIFNTNLK
jgi:hypothetical protein